MRSFRSMCLELPCPPASNVHAPSRLSPCWYGENQWLLYSVEGVMSANEILSAMSQPSDSCWDRDWLRDRLCSIIYDLSHTQTCTPLWEHPSMQTLTCFLQMLSSYKWRVFGIDLLVVSQMLHNCRHWCFSAWDFITWSIFLMLKISMRLQKLTYILMPWEKSIWNTLQINWTVNSLWRGVLCFLLGCFSGACL